MYMYMDCDRKTPFPAFCIARMNQRCRISSVNRTVSALDVHQLRSFSRATDTSLVLSLNPEVVLIAF